jgi:hypothetical protein
MFPTHPRGENVEDLVYMAREHFMKAFDRPVLDYGEDEPEVAAMLHERCMHCAQHDPNDYRVMYDVIEDSYALFEVSRHGDRLIAASTRPAIPCAKTLEQLRELCKAYMACLSQPVFVAENNAGPRLVRP